MDISIENIKEVLINIQERIAVLESNLPCRVDGWGLCENSKLPWKAMVYRGSLMWRMVELSRVALSSFESGNLAASIILTRSAVEVTAALWYLSIKLEATVQSKTKGDISDYLTKLLMGTKLYRDIRPECEAINVKTFLKHLDKDWNGFSHQYDVLSEFLHPNWAGTSFLYSKDDQPNLWTDFGVNIRDCNSAKIAVLVNLTVSLSTFEFTHNSISAMMPSFIEICGTD